MRESITSFEDGQQRDWENPLPIIRFPDEDQAVSLYPTMDKAIEKCSKVIDRHSMMIKKKEHNSWIDDSYLLIGQAQFYKRIFPEAQETFKYITKQYKKEPIRHEAELWMARMSIEQKKYTRAETILETLGESKKDFPKGMEKTYHEVYTHLYLEQERWKDAIEPLQRALLRTKKKERRAYQTFLLAQLYDLTGESRKAVRRYGDVVKMNPDYEMKFYAQINQALAFDSRSDSEKIRASLNKMLKDQKYIEFRDQIYYALAEVEFAERNVDAGIDMLLESTEASVGNNRQKGKSFLRLAEIYFDERQYETASRFYDSTVTFLPSDYPGFPIVQATKESLSDLVFHLQRVDHEDSVQSIAVMEKADRDKRLRQIIKQYREQEEERRRLEREAQAAEFASRQEAQRIQQENRAVGGGGSGRWYFYNETAKAQGFAEFKATFGQRPLKDHWRRSDKTQLIIGGSEGEEAIAEEEGVKGAIPTIEELEAGLPLTEEEMKASNDTIAASLFAVGKIYKDRLEDFENAIETFEGLNVRLPGNPFEQVTYYQLYRLFLKKEEDPNYFASDFRSTSAYYKDLITSDYPQSEFAKIIEDPEYVVNSEKDRKAEVEAYESTFRLYRQRSYNEVLVACLDVMNNQPENRLLPKYNLLRAMAIAGKKDRTNYIKSLQEVIIRFPGTEEAKEAKRLLGLLDEDESPKTEDTAKLEEKEDKKDTEGEEEKEEDKPKGDYVVKNDMNHYFAILIPNRGAKMNELKAKVSDFNGNYFSDKTLKVTNSFIDADSQILLVRTFKDKSEGLNYLNAFSSNDDELGGLNDQGHDAFVITSKNFATLFKTKDIQGYISFFQENYNE